MTSQPKAITIRYRNWKGEIAFRNILPQRLYFGSTEYHPEPQWLLEATDLDKVQSRTFAMKDILAWDVPGESQPGTVVEEETTHG